MSLRSSTRETFDVIVETPSSRILLLNIVSLHSKEHQLMLRMSMAIILKENTAIVTPSTMKTTTQ
jgi:hypothetical protein